MEIDKKIIEKIIPSTPIEGVKVSLFIVSTKRSGLKQLNLSGLTSAERAAKLKKWGESSRFVTLIETGDKIFAHVHSKHAEKLNGLSIDEKSVTVKNLTDEEYEELALIGEAFEESLLTDSPDKTETPESDPAIYKTIRQFFAESTLLSDQIHVGFIIAKMEAVSSKMILDCVRRMNEERREVQKQNQLDDLKKEIVDREIKRSIRRGHIVEGEIQTQELRSDTIEQDSLRVARARGAS